MVIAAKLTRQTHRIAIQLHLVAVHFSLQAASSETFGYTLVYTAICYVMSAPIFATRVQLMTDKTKVTKKLVFKCGK